MPTDETAEPEPEAAPETPPEPDATPAPEPEPVEPEPSRPRYRLLAFAAVVCLVIAATTYFVTSDDDPVGVVEDFFAAIVDKDVEAALSYVGRIGYGIPYGERAAFLHPDAIADGWRLLDAEHFQEDYDDYVDITIGDDANQVSGRLEVTDYNGEWNIVDPFVEVEVSATALTYLAVNDRRVVTTELYEHNAMGVFQNTIKLLPGRYTFFGDIPGTASTPPPALDLLPAPETSEPRVISPPNVVLTPEIAAAVQASGDALIDDCATFTTPNPVGCPFGIGDFLTKGEWNLVENVRDVTWEVVTRPVLTVDGALGGDPPTGLAVKVAGPGLIRLTATGDIDVEEVRFRADCTVDGEFLRVALRPDGTPELYPAPALGLFVTTTGPPGTCVYKGEL